MKIRNPKYYLLLAILTISISAKTQNIKNDIAKLNNFYSQTSSFYADISIKIYSTPTCKEPFSTSHAVIKKKGNNFLYTLDNRLMLSNNNSYIVVDNDTKLILFSQHPGRENVNTPMTFDIDSLISSADSIKFNGIKGDILKYTAYTKKSLIQESQIEFTTAGIIKRMTYLYNPESELVSGKVIIDFKNINTSPQFAASEFDSKKYVRINGNEVSPATEYIAYDLQVISED